MFESHKRPLLPRRHYFRRLAQHFLITMGLLLGSLLIGMAGYAYYENLPWRSAFLNSAMLLGGMGPVDAPQTDAGKLFAGIYALYAGLIFLIGTAIMLAPALHRMLHRFHLGQEQ